MSDASVAKRSPTAQSPSTEPEVSSGKRFCLVHFDVVDADCAITVAGNLRYDDGKERMPIGETSLCRSVPCQRCAKPFAAGSSVNFYRPPRYALTAVAEHSECSVPDEKTYPTMVYHSVFDTHERICKSKLVYLPDGSKEYIMADYKCRVCNKPIDQCSTVLFMKPEQGTNFVAVHADCGKKCAEPQCCRTVSDPSQDVLCPYHSIACTACQGNMTVPGRMTLYAFNWSRVYVHDTCNLDSATRYADYTRLGAIACSDPDCHSKHLYVQRSCAVRATVDGRIDSVWCCRHISCACCEGKLPEFMSTGAVCNSYVNGLQFCSNCTLLRNTGDKAVCGCSLEGWFCKKHFGLGWHGHNDQRKAGFCRVCNKLIRDCDTGIGHLDSDGNVVHHSCEISLPDDELSQQQQQQKNE